MKCKKCGNEDPAYFYYGDKGWYCRKCVRFSSGSVLENNSREVDAEYKLKFKLTDKQSVISERLRQLVSEGKEVLLEAVCGAGKTEIIFAMISDQLKKGHKVCFSIARRQVVLEIAERLTSAFGGIKVVAVCQGHTSDINGDLVVCTTHQLFRFTGYFDVLIIDEPDAFPYKGDETLAGIARNSCTGTMVYLTATPDAQLTSMVLEGKLEHLFLSKRPHGYELCVPEVRYGNDLMMLIHLINWIRMELRKEKQLLVFVPRRKTGQLFTRVINRFIPCCNIDSTTEDKDEIIQQFRDGKYQICVTTSVLERGVTFYDVQVVVWKADNGVFDEAALTQIAGRVGRSPKAPYGDCLFLCNRKQRSVDGCIDRIRKANDD